MGATVTCGVRVAAFRNPETRDITYVLFESTYEKNCTPHIPHESVIAIGGIQAVLQRVFACASACEGGDLQGRSGHIRPESYLAGWMKSFEAPASFDPSAPATIRFGSGLYDFPTDIKDAVVANASRSGIDQALINRLDNEQVTVPISHPLVMAILDAGGSPWKFGLSLPHHIEVDSALGYAPVRTKTPEPPKVCWLFPNSDVLLEYSEGVWRRQTGFYGTVRGLIRDLWRTPGCYRQAIKGAREACKNAPSFGPETVVTLNAITPSTPRWISERYAELVSELGISTLPGSIPLDRLASADPSRMYTVKNAAEYGLVEIDAANAVLLCATPEPKSSPKKPEMLAS